MTEDNQRTNQSFLADLRKEVFQTQERRGKILALKLTFISSFFGIGALEKVKGLSLEINTYYVFYIIPFIALIFDLYLMGEDYAVKRAGNFLKYNRSTPPVEKEWEEYIEDGKRDVFSTWAYRISTVLIVLFCVLMLIPEKVYMETTFWIWVSFCILYIILQFLYKAIVARRLSKSNGVKSPARVEHLAIWVDNLELMKDFYIMYFKMNNGSKYVNEKKGFSSYFLYGRSGTRIELMHNATITKKNKKRGEVKGLAHFALSVGSKDKVDSLTREIEQNGYTVVGLPRTTGDGYYESVVTDPEGNLIELTV